MDNARQGAAANSIFYSLCGCSGGVLTCKSWLGFSQALGSRAGLFQKDKTSAGGSMFAPCWSRPEPTWTDSTFVKPFGVLRPACAMILAAARPAMPVNQDMQATETPQAKARFTIQAGASPVETTRSVQPLHCKVRAGQGPCRGPAGHICMHACMHAGRIVLPAESSHSARLRTCTRPVPAGYLPVLPQTR